MDGNIAFLIGETPVYSYGLFVALGAVLFSLILFIGMRKRGLKGFAGRAVICVAAGFVCARVFFCLLDQGFLAERPFGEIVRPDYGGFSMMGALLGAGLGLLIVCRAGRCPAGDTLDAAAPALLAFTAACRAGEWGSEELGLSRPLKTEGLLDTFLDSDGYLKVYLLELAAAVILFVIVVTVLKKRYRHGGVMLGAMLLFGGTQVILESLKHDGHMSFGFVGVQHILSYCILVSALVILSVGTLRSGRKALPRAALLSVLPVAGVCVWIEFLLDRTPTDRWLLYGLYIVLMAAQCALGFKMLASVEKMNGGRSE